jgi:hypothetical protein
MAARLLLILLAAVALAAGGCTANRLYAWGNYDDTLYAHYKNPGDAEENLARLQKIVETNEAAGQKMPPGVYAQYGYALYEAGRSAEALTCFEKERATWPESAVLMEKLRRNLERRQPRQDVAKSSEPAPAPAAIPGGER